MHASPDYELRPWQRRAIEDDGTAPCLTCAGTGTIDVDRNFPGPCPDCAGRGFHDHDAIIDGKRTQ